MVEFTGTRKKGARNCASAVAAVLIFVAALVLVAVLITVIGLVLILLIHNSFLQKVFAVSPLH